MIPPDPSTLSKVFLKLLKFVRKVKICGKLTLDRVVARGTRAHIEPDRARILQSGRNQGLLKASPSPRSAKLPAILPWKFPEVARRIPILKKFWRLLEKLTINRQFLRPDSNIFLKRRFEIDGVPHLVEHEVNRLQNRSPEFPTIVPIRELAEHCFGSQY